MSNESPYDIFCVTFAIDVSLFAQKTVNAQKRFSADPDS